MRVASKRQGVNSIVGSSQETNLTPQGLLKILLRTDSAIRR